MRVLLHSVGLALLLASAASACVTPVVVVDEMLYVGLWSVTTDQPHKAVSYSSVEGVGLALGLYSIGFGYLAVTMTRVDLEHAGSFSAWTPIATVHVGDHAERLALLAHLPYWGIPDRNSAP